ncbi:MAG: hypothetical protein EXS64_10820 [Candidatus Latescibacteria bacterium]|nr:hypothetical protein [Candidatus Latescibacterota bacterium]
MGTGQTLLVLGAVVLLSTVALTINRSLLNNDQVSVQMNVGLAATSVCRSVLEDKARMDFDSLAVGTTVIQTATPIGTFPCTLKVAYVQDTAPDNAVAGPTSYKKVSAIVTSPYLDYNVQLHTVVADY